ncbi:putative uridine kinase C227.14 isoform X2 [Alnus glutinosa]|nr:putative uridine kinase C227.14 isoform X2 [Alnus glutinosa]
MEVSLSLTTTRGYSESLLLQKRVKLPLWNRCIVSISSTRAVVPPLFAQTGIPIGKPNNVKVLCSQIREIPVVEGRCIDEIPVVEGRCIDDIYDALAQRLLPTAAAIASNPKLKYIVGLAGPPGSGKSTLANEVARRVNKLWPQKASSLDSQVKPPDVAMVLPMDGFHLHRSQLDKMENPKEAHARRGAPWTFDPARLLSCLQTLRKQGSVFVPSFDHGIGDPVEDDIFVGFQHKVIIVEGNYIFMEDGVWKDISSTFDEK